MTLNECKKNKMCIVVNICCDNHKLRLRLCEIGFFKHSKIKVLNRSFMNKTLLVNTLDSCFAIKSNVAKLIEVEYA